MAISLLLDTHTLLWWLFDDPQLSEKARTHIAKSTNRIFVSSASGWEISIKHKLGKLPEIGEVIKKLPHYIRKEHFEILPISIEHALLAGGLPEHHKDPFDRMLISQAKIEKLHVVTTDQTFKKYHCDIIW